MWIDNPDIAQPVCGLQAALLVIMELLIAKEMLTAEELSRSLENQANEMISRHELPDAAPVLRLLVRQLNDPELVLTRELFQAPPRGSA